MGQVVFMSDEYCEFIENSGICSLHTSTNCIYTFLYFYKVIMCIVRGLSLCHTKNYYFCLKLIVF